jgi:hypothetical protein
MWSNTVFCIVIVLHNGQPCTWELVPGTPSFCTLNKSSKWWLFRWFWLVHSHFAIHCGPQKRMHNIATGSIVIVLMVFDFTAKLYVYQNSSDSRRPKRRVLKRREAQWRHSRDLNIYVWAGERYLVQWHLTRADEVQSFGAPVRQ